MTQKRSPLMQLPVGHCCVFTHDALHQTETTTRIRISWTCMHNKPSHAPFLSPSIRARENDLETKKTLEPVTRSPIAKKYGNTKRNQTWPFVTKTSPEQLETEFCHAISTTILRTLGADDRTPNTCCTFPTQPTPLQKPPTHHHNQNVQIVHRNVRNYGHACVGPASEAARN